MADKYASSQQIHPTTADNLMEKLPIQMSAKAAKDNPNFCRLLSILSLHFTTNGTNTTAQEELDQAKERLKQAKFKWLQYDILYRELHEWLIDHQIQAGTATSVNSKQFYRAVQESVNLAEIGDYLHCNPDPSNPVTLLGLTHADVDAYHPHKKNQASLQQKLIPELELRLRARCEKLASFYEVSDSSQLCSNAISQSTELPAKLRATADKIDTLEQCLHRDRDAHRKLSRQYHQALLDLVSLMERVMLKHRMGTQSENDTVVCEWLAARCDAMMLKIKLLEKQLLCDTYNTSSVQALTLIRRELDAAVNSAHREHVTASRSLQTYQSVGVGFEELIKEYTQVREDIENRKRILCAANDCTHSM